MNTVHPNRNQKSPRRDPEAQRKAGHEFHELHETGWRSELLHNPHYTPSVIPKNSCNSWQVFLSSILSPRIVLVGARVICVHPCSSVVSINSFAVRLCLFQNDALPVQTVSRHAQEHALAASSLPALG